MNICAVIMAGGKGERFWPRSRQKMPKQFLSIEPNNKTMLENTVDRIAPLINTENIFIVTNQIYKNLVKQQLPDIPEENIICEPEGRNTAPCIALAAVIIEAKYGNSIMITLASDHIIKDNNSFIETIKTGIKKAEQGENLITLGIAPKYAETGYGYIKYDKNSIHDGCYTVERFVEKPNREKAESYIKDGCYLWNSGMFIWQTSTILSKFKQLMTDVYEKAVIIGKAYRHKDYEDILNKKFVEMESQSIDYGIMEKTSPIFTIVSDFGWDDAGSWLSIDRIMKKDADNNILNENSVDVNSKNITILSENKLIATAGLENIVVVDTEDVILICSKDNTQDVKEILQQIKARKMDKYL